MFARNTVHAVSPCEGEEEPYEYKGTAFSCMEDSLGPDVKARAVVLTLEHLNQLLEHYFVLTPEANLVLERSNTCLKVGVRTLFKRC